ncbi:aldehyde dehydrogenase family protein [Rhodoplanes serenus]
MSHTTQTTMPTAGAPVAGTATGADGDRIAALFAAQRQGVAVRRVSFDYAARLVALERLRDALVRREADIVAALAADFGKPATEVLLTEILPVRQEIAHARRHLRRWMRPRRVRPTLGLIGTAARVRPEPKGVCLIIAPWNYPLNLALGPLVSALAAGNAVMLKPSELAPATSTLIASLIAETFPPGLVAVVEGDATVAERLLALPFDHIFFTGSPAVGRIVMAAAARTLASVTLELGGKSPAIVGPGADPRKAARWIAWGKFANAGQTCIAPDHVFVHRSVADRLVAALEAEIARAYGADPSARRHSPDYARIVSRRHADRLHGLIESATGAGAQVLAGGEADPLARYVAPTLIARTTLDMAVSQEEIFGPVLPVIAYDDLDQVIARIDAGPKPLALYVFDRSRSFAEAITARTSSGAVGINLTLAHFLHVGLPFGGIGQSGIGAAHGEHGFRAFSHEKAILRDRFSVTPLLFPPYTPLVQRLVRLTLRLLG